MLTVATAAASGWSCSAGLLAIKQTSRVVGEYSIIEPGIRVAIYIIEMGGFPRRVDMFFFHVWGSGLF